jgi:hypothetical protein
VLDRLDVRFHNLFRRLRFCAMTETITQISLSV